MAGTKLSPTTIDQKSANPRMDDADADRITFFWIVAFMLAFLSVDILSATTEAARNENQHQVSHFAIWQTTSVFIIVCFIPAIAWVTSRATPGQHPWRHVIATHIGASIVFSLIHVALMVALRKTIFLLFLGRTYTFSDNLARDLIYEYRKDVLTYTMVVFFITFGRQLAQQRREIAAAREDAKKSHRVTLKCGGRSIWLNAQDVHWVKSASNYVEVAANGKTHLARATLTAIERQLTDSGAKAIRVHRSYVINADHIQEVRPTGEGDVKIEMPDGVIVPGSRRYRDKLNALLEAS
ncbi:MAG: hypothetical protein DHS20C05_21700 [Hyphococcus sp.]|nr:MAG: hypothetical protein DHS20C05_21700 [Marinicaulis sp.]